MLAHLTYKAWVPTWGSQSLRCYIFWKHLAKYKKSPLLKLLKSFRNVWYSGILNWTFGKEKSISASMMIKISNATLTDSNLSLMGLTSKCLKKMFLGCLDLTLFNSGEEISSSLSSLWILSWLTVFLVLESFLPQILFDLVSEISGFETLLLAF